MKTTIDTEKPQPLLLCEFDVESVEAKRVTRNNRERLRARKMKDRLNEIYDHVRVREGEIGKRRIGRAKKCRAIIGYIKKLQEVLQGKLLVAAQCYRFSYVSHNCRLK